MFVQRNARGQIVAAYTEPQFRTQEPVPDDDAALRQYLARTVMGQKLFSTTGLSVDDVALLVTRLGMYVERGPDEGIVSASATPQRDFQERLPLDAVDLIAFTNEQPPEPEPLGYRYQHVRTGWRILGLGDGSVLAQGLPNREACVGFMRDRASRKAEGLKSMLRPNPL